MRRATAMVWVVLQEAMEKGAFEQIFALFATLLVVWIAFHMYQTKLPQFSEPGPVASTEPTFGSIRTSGFFDEQSVHFIVPMQRSIFRFGLLCIQNGFRDSQPLWMLEFYDRHVEGLRRTILTDEQAIEALMQIYNIRVQRRLASLIQSCGIDYADKLTEIISLGLWNEIVVAESIHALDEKIRFILPAGFYW